MTPAFRCSIEAPLSLVRARVLLSENRAESRSKCNRGHAFRAYHVAVIRDHFWFLMLMAFVVFVTIIWLIVWMLDPQLLARFAS